MSATAAALATVRDVTTGKSLLALSGPLPRPHNPLLRHGLTPVGPEAGIPRQSLADPSGQFCFTSHGDESDAFEETDAMTEPVDPHALEIEADDDLLVRYQQLDDHAALAELDRRYHRLLLAYARKFHGGVLRELAEEIVQDAFLSFHKRRKTYAPKKGVSALLYRIVSNHCKNRWGHIRAQKRDHRLTCSLRESDPDRKADPARHQSKMDLDDMLKTLPPKEAEAVRLGMEGHSAESAGKLLNVPARTMRGRTERGINALRKLAATSLILLAVVGSVADGCDLDVYMNVCSAETDEDEVCREDGGHHDSDKQRRKSVMRLPIWPDAAEVDPNMTSMTRVVNARHEDYDVLIARPSKWGNPFQIGRDGDRERVIRMYEVHVRRRPDLLAALPELAGKRLGCYCKPEACHGDVLVKLLRELLLEV
jgi:RNA polymerase sigma factor (sigma-70 family)